MFGYFFCHGERDNFFREARYFGPLLVLMSCGVRFFSVCFIDAVVLQARGGSEFWEGTWFFITVFNLFVPFFQFTTRRDHV